jgi:hypothetical protein
MGSTQTKLNPRRAFLLFWFFILLVLYILFWGYPAYETQKHLAEGWVSSTTWDCPVDHPIKANLKSMIYHLPNDPYWSRTDAKNGECFDTTKHAVEQGFRASYGTPATSAAAPLTSIYKGGYAPDGTFCDYGYDPNTKNCCNEDDYSCETRDEAPAGATTICMDGTYDFHQIQSDNCLQNGGVDTDPEFSPFLSN